MKQRNSRCMRHLVTCHLSLVTLLRMNIVVIGLSHHSAPVELRERFAFAEAKIPDALKSLRESGVAGEAVILSTCNRVEIYAATALEAGAGRFAELKTISRATAIHRLSRLAALGRRTLHLAEPQSLQHLFKVACGLDSMVLGETEILGQLKKAYDAGASPRPHRRAAEQGFSTRLQRRQTRPHRNQHPARQRVRGVGRGGTGGENFQFARRPRSHGHRRRRHERKNRPRPALPRRAQHHRRQPFARPRGGAGRRNWAGAPCQFDDWAAEFEKIDIVISSTAAPHHILDRAQLEPLMKTRHHRPLLLIDIAVPRDIDPEVNFLENVYLYNIDDLQAIADDYLKQRQEEIARCEAIIAEKVKALLGTKIQPRMTRMDTDANAAGRLAPSSLPSVLICVHPRLNNGTERPIIIATRGSALALAQANLIAAQCRETFPRLRFELKIIKTTGDKLQKASMAKVEGGLPKGLVHQGTRSRAGQRPGRPRRSQPEGFADRFARRTDPRRHAQTRRRARRADLSRRRIHPRPAPRHSLQPTGRRARTRCAVSSRT